MIKCLLCVWLAAVTAGAQIEWMQDNVSLQVHPVQLKAEAVFRFTNVGSAPISISDVSVTCGCMAARPVKPSYAPGEEGVLTIMLDLKERVGPFNKRINVKTSDGKATVLTVTSNIPAAYKTQTKLIRWAEGERSQTKAVLLENPNSVPVRLLSVSSSHEALPAELKTVRDGFAYEVIITRRPGTENARSVIRIATAPPPGFTESKTIKLYAHAP